MLLNNLVVFAPQRAFDERTDIYYYRVIQSINSALMPHEVHLRYCALEENDSDANQFLARMNELGLDEKDYGFYLDLRKYGSTRHAGFGLGFERCVMYLTGMSNIRDVIPFPRTVNNCEL